MTARLEELETLLTKKIQTLRLAPVLAKVTIAEDVAALTLALLGETRLRLRALETRMQEIERQCQKVEL